MSQITILLLYALAAVAFAASRLPRFDARSRALKIAAFAFVVAATIIHGEMLVAAIRAGDGFKLTLTSAISLIGLELALIAIVAAADPTLRGLSAGLLVLAALCGLATGVGEVTPGTRHMVWQLRMHVTIAMAAYGLLTVGAIVAVYALVQEKRLHAGRISAANRLFAPLETTERLLYGISTAGVVLLAATVLAGTIFIENLFDQHLAHKAILSILALVVFGVLLVGHYLAGWRGKRGVYLYLGGYVLLALAYFGSRFILENVLGRTWG